MLAHVWSYSRAEKQQGWQQRAFCAAIPIIHCGCWLDIPYMRIAIGSINSPTLMTPRTSTSAAYGRKVGQLLLAP